VSEEYRTNVDFHLNMSVRVKKGLIARNNAGNPFILRLIAISERSNLI